MSLLSDVQLSKNLYQNSTVKSPLEAVSRLDCQEIIRLFNGVSSVYYFTHESAPLVPFAS
jgi:hypothetical protein